MTGEGTASDDEAVLEFLRVMRRLRAECPWKAAQTHRSLARYLLEETHETLEALDTGDTGHLREELGDLLLQVFLHTAIAEEAGDFTTADVARDITEKMYHRNPHVFGDETGADLDPAAVNELWEARKADEKQRASVTDGLAPGLPALLYADKVLDRLGRASGAASTRDVPATDDLGDRLLALVVEARAEGTDPEQALRDAVRRLL
jgi:XTP/dITP diphosphohydrolase